MKKASLLLIAVAVVSIGGGALAYKVRNVDNVFYMNTVVSGQKICTVGTILHYEITDFGGQSTLLSTYPTYTQCPTIIITNLL